MIPSSAARGYQHKCFFGRERVLKSVFEISFSSKASSHPFPGLDFFHAFLFAGFVIDGMLLYLFDDCFLLDFPLETLERRFD